MVSIPRHHVALELLSNTPIGLGAPRAHRSGGQNRTPNATVQPAPAKQEVLDLASTVLGITTGRAETAINKLASFVDTIESSGHSNLRLVKDQYRLLEWTIIIHIYQSKGREADLLRDMLDRLLIKSSKFRGRRIDVNKASRMINLVSPTPNSK